MPNPIFRPYSLGGFFGTPSPSQQPQDTTTTPTAVPNTTVPTVSPDPAASNNVFNPLPNDNTNQTNDYGSGVKNTGLFKFGYAPNVNPIQQAQPEQGPRFKVNEAMMRSPYYNPYFTTFQ